jgi:NADPH2:quinone reductase
VTYDELSEVEPVDVILDQVGGELFTAGVKLLRPLGAIIGIGFAGGAWQPLDPALLVGRSVSATGFYLGRFMKLRPDVVRTAAAELLERWSAGAIAPVVGATYPLEEADEALRLVADRRSTGKVVLVP